MGHSKHRILGTSVLPSNVMPGRTCGPTGYNDAGDPSALMCVAGDTPGPVGTGGDESESMCMSPPEPVSLPPKTSTLAVKVLYIDLARVRHALYVVAYAKAADAAATRGFASADVDLGEQGQIERAAHKLCDQLVEEFGRSAEGGPDVLRSFLEYQEREKERARASLKSKLDAAMKAGRQWHDVLGWSIKGLAALKFGSTVTIKTLSIVTGGAGTAIDFVYSGAQAGIKQATSPEEGKSIGGVVISETFMNYGQDRAEVLNEWVANAFMTKAERNQIEGLLGNYKGNADKIAAQLEKVEERVRKALAAGKSGRLASLAAEEAKKLAKLQSLRIKTAQALLGKGAPGLAKKALGKVATVVFLANDVAEAWNDMVQEMQASN